METVLEEISEQVRNPQFKFIPTAMLEFDGGYSQEQAECLALVELGLPIDGDIDDENF